MTTEIKDLHDCKTFTTLFKADTNGRKINIYTFENCTLTGLNLYYPNILFKTLDNQIYRPIKEAVMSLKKIKHSNTFTVKPLSKYKIIDRDNNFFFVYNTDNYYHFVYDTLPYLISFNSLKKKIPDLKLLMQYPNPNKKNFYPFVIEFLSLCGISKHDIKIINNKTLYTKIFVSTSYTHDFNSNLPPRKEIYSFYKSIVKKVKINKKTPSKIYISRRSWIHGDNSNIGTDYTTRRKLINEDQLVKELTTRGFAEVFTELLSTQEKIHLFANAKHVIGSMGGGLCNVLFSKKNCKLTAIVSPYFLKINDRFKYSFSNVDCTFFNKTKNTENTKLKTFMRVKVKNIVGEIIAIKNNKAVISYSDTPVAGWNNTTKYKTKTVCFNDCFKLDKGINSPWKVNLKQLLKHI